MTRRADAKAGTAARVLHFVPGFRSGGIESLLMEQFRCLEGRLQYDFLVDSVEQLDAFAEVRAGGGRVFQMGRYLDAPIRYQRTLMQILREHGPGYVALHSHVVVRALPVLWAARWCGIRRRIIHSHSGSLKGTPEHRLLALIAPLSLALGTDYWACSQLAGQFMFRRRPFLVVPNTISAGRFAFDVADRCRIRRRLGFGDQALVIGHTGRFTYLKNHEGLIGMFAQLRKRRSDSFLLLVGDGPTRAHCLALARRLGVADWILFAGEQEDVAAHLSAMDVFVLPSHCEGFSISLLEAQANGLPCVVSSAIPDEVCLDKLVTVCGLDRPPDVWCDLLLQAAERGRMARQECAALVGRAGFETRSSIAALVDLYCGNPSGG